MHITGTIAVVVVVVSVWRYTNPKMKHKKTCMTTSNTSQAHISTHACIHAHSMIVCLCLIRSAQCIRSTHRCGCRGIFSTVCAILMCNLVVFFFVPLLLLLSFFLVCWMPVNKWLGREECCVRAYESWSYYSLVPTYSWASICLACVVGMNKKYLFTLHTHILPYRALCPIHRDTETQTHIYTHADETNMYKSNTRVDRPEIHDRHAFVEKYGM